MDALPAAQRQAVALAFFGELTHEQVARKLDLPLGTAKTRIRTGLQTLRTRLTPLAASLLALALVVVAPWSRPGAVVLAALLYVPLLFVTGTFDRDERRALRSLLPARLIAVGASR
jgi:hypothetical protein